MKKVFMRPLCLVLLLAFFPVRLVLAKEKAAPAPATLPSIQTHWATLGGMQYLREGKALSGPELDRTLHALDDRQVDALLGKSESDETLGLVGLGGSVALSVLSLFFPNNHIHVIGLDISTPYLPLAVPGAVLGIGGGLLEMEAGTAKYAAVQRYNRMTRPGPVAFRICPGDRGLGLRIGCAF